MKPLYPGKWRDSSSVHQYFPVNTRTLKQSQPQKGKDKFDLTLKRRNRVKCSRLYHEEQY